MSSRVLLVSVLLACFGACAHAPGATPVRSPVAQTSPALAVSEPTAAQPPAATVHLTQLADLTWKLRLADDAPWQTVPTSVHTFSVGRWECALGATQADDIQGERELHVQSARKLACTHVTGATVQTQLTCPLTLDNPDDNVRELELVLDTSQPVRLACAPVRDITR